MKKDKIDTTQSGIMNWDPQALKESMQKKSEERLADLGFKPTVKIPEGESVFDVVMKSVREVETDYGTRFVFDLADDKALMATEYLATMILDVSKPGDEVLKIKILRIGTDKTNTKYKVSRL